MSYDFYRFKIEKPEDERIKKLGVSTLKSKQSSFGGQPGKKRLFSARTSTPNLKKPNLAYQM